MLYFPYFEITDKKHPFTDRIWSIWSKHTYSRCQHTASKPHSVSLHMMSDHLDIDWFWLWTDIKKSIIYKYILSRDTSKSAFDAIFLGKKPKKRLFGNPTFLSLWSVFVETMVPNLNQIIRLYGNPIFLTL